MATKQTKAQRIFEDTMTEIRNYIRAFGLDNPENTVFYFQTEEVVYNRTLNAMQKLLDREVQANRLSERFGCTSKHLEIRKKAAIVMQNTINEWHRRNDLFNAACKGKISWDEYFAA